MPTETSPDPETPPLSVPAQKRFGWIALLAIAAGSAAAAATAGYLAGRPDGELVASDEATAELYQCPMHPTVVQDHPGDCPICGMKLVKIDKAAPGAVPGAAPASERKPLFYRSPMDPHQTSPTPRKDEMGMDYLPVYADDVAGDSRVEGLSTVSIDPSRQQLIGLTTAAVTRGGVGGSWRTVGRVAIDETRVRHVNIKVPVFVERIFVNFVGQPVRKGQPLFSVYSPELLSTQEELLLALRTQSRLGGAELLGDGDALVAAARRKLELWDVPASEIERLERTKTPSKELTFYSPIAGVVTKKDVVEGMRLEAGAMPYEIVDLSKVWVLADVYESELRHMKVGMAATLTLKAFPSRTFTGSIAFIDPLLDPKTRTVKVRLTFPNPTGDLRPELFGEVVLRGPSRDVLRIPLDAVIDSGTKSVVFVSLGEGRFQPREIGIGERDERQVEVTQGLREGERVVTRANFLVDSESRLRASLAAIGSAEPAQASAKEPAPEPEMTATPAPSETPSASPTHVLPAPRAARRPAASRPARKPEPAPQREAAPEPAPASQAASTPTQHPAASTPSKPQAAPIYQCPMHPDVRQDHPGRCPICGMNLVEVQKAEPAPTRAPPSQAGHDHAGHGAHGGH